MCAESTKLPLSVAFFPGESGWFGQDKAGTGICPTYPLFTASNEVPSFLYGGLGQQNRAALFAN